jgi:hypothetical protein
MWTTPAKYRRDYTIYVFLILAGLVVVFQTIWTRDMLWVIFGCIPWLVAMFVAARVLLRCDSCGTGIVWWWTTNSRLRDPLHRILRAPACPVCRYHTAAGERPER